MRYELPCGCGSYQDLRYVGENVLVACPVCKKKYMWKVVFIEVKSWKLNQ